MARNREYDVLGFATHHRPHLDEIVARWLLDVAASGRLGAINNPISIAPDASFDEWESSGGQTPDGRSAQDWLEQDGILALGVGGGVFDEHDNRTYVTAVPYCAMCGGKNPIRFCATDLVAHHLGVERNPMLQILLRYVHANDCHKRGGIGFDLARKVLELNRLYNPSAEDLYQHIKVAELDLHWAKQTAFFSAREAFERTADSYVVPVPINGGMQEIAVAVIGSKPGQPGDADHEWIVDWAGSEYGGAHTVIVHRGEDGLTQIIVRNPLLRRQMAVVAAVLRYIETLCRDQRRQDSFEQMSANNTWPGAPNWHFQEDSGNLLNGSSTHRDVEASRIQLSTVVQVLLAVLKDHRKVTQNWSDLDSFLKWNVETEKLIAVSMPVMSTDLPKALPQDVAAGREAFQRAGRSFPFEVYREDRTVQMSLAVICEREGVQSGDVDHPQVMAWAASQEEGQHNVVVRQATSGHFEIDVVDARLKNALQSIVAVMRYLETVYSGGEDVRRSYSDLSREQIEGSNWCRTEKGVVNVGTATAIPLDSICDALLYVCRFNSKVARAWEEIHQVLSRVVNFPQPKRPRKGGKRKQTKRSS